MRTCDVNGFRSRSDAAFGTLALNYIAEQLYQRGEGFFVDAVTVIEMKDTGSVVFHKEPLDWVGASGVTYSFANVFPPNKLFHFSPKILFNNILDHMKGAKPKSHGNYVKSLELAERIIQDEFDLCSDLDPDDISEFLLMFISDGKPSDKHPHQKERRTHSMVRLAKLQSKLTFIGVGIGASGSDFLEMKALTDTVSCLGANGSFVHAGLNPISISSTLSSVATSMTTLRNDLLTNTQSATKIEKVYTMKKKDCQDVPLHRERDEVVRFVYDPRLQDDPWRAVGFINWEASGFEFEEYPFAKGAERLAHMFYEVKHTRNGCERVEKAMVAKESRFVQSEGSKYRFQTSSIRVQHKARELAIEFNEAVKKMPHFQPAGGDDLTPPPMLMFLKCSLYEYTGKFGETTGIIVENFLKGKFTKFNGNNGYVNDEAAHDSVTINLAIGEVKLTDFIQAFSHWVFVTSGNNMIICDLQGVIDLEGRLPIIRLTDPAICSKSKADNRYGKTDIGMKGIRSFCCSHKCNDVCKGLNLPTMNARA
jgi:hypothetical protein